MATAISSTKRWWKSSQTCPSMNGSMPGNGDGIAVPSFRSVQRRIRILADTAAPCQRPMAAFPWAHPGGAGRSAGVPPASPAQVCRHVTISDRQAGCPRSDLTHALASGSCTCSVGGAGGARRHAAPRPPAGTAQSSTRVSRPGQVHRGPPPAPRPEAPGVGAQDGRSGDPGRTPRRRLHRARCPVAGHSPAM